MLKALTKLLVLIATTGIASASKLEDLNGGPEHEALANLSKVSDYNQGEVNQNAESAKKFDYTLGMKALGNSLFVYEKVFINGELVAKNGITSYLTVLKIDPVRAEVWLRLWVHHNIKGAVVCPYFDIDKLCNSEWAISNSISKNDITEIPSHGDQRYMFSKASSKKMFRMNGEVVVIFDTLLLGPGPIAHANWEKSN